MSATVHPRSRRHRLLAGVLVTVSCVAALVAARPSAAAASGPYKMRVPANFVSVSSVSNDRCLWGVGIEFPSVAHATGYTIEYWDGYWGATEYGFAGVPVAHTKGMTRGMNYFGVTGGGGPAPCGAIDPTMGGRFDKGAKVWVTFAHKPTAGFIEGTITDRDDSGSGKHKKADSPVEGAVIKAYGDGTHYTATSGPGGIYFMRVPAGHSYRVVPDDTAVKTSTFTPTYASVHVAKAKTETANFRLNGGLKVELDLSRSSVAADGTQIVHATLTTTKYGKAAPNESVVLTVDPADEDAALTSAAKVSVCSVSGRIWPTGAMSDTLSLPVTVTTGAKGVDQFTLAVGTVPGRWSLEAWGKNEDGELSSDVANASDTKTLDVSALTPNTSLADFTTELAALKSQLTFSSADPASLATTLSGLAATGHTTGVHLGGLVFSVANSSHGTVLVISPATSAPDIATDGTVKNAGATTNDLVLDPADWNIVQNGGLTLLQALQSGEIHNLPTLGQWESGASVSGWNLSSGMTITVPNQSVLQQFGWSYGTTCG